MPDMQSLSLRVKYLNESVDFWNLIMIWALALAALAAVVVGVVTRIVISRSAQLGTAQSLLSDEKERMLQGHLKQKDLEISELTLRSDFAATGIATAQSDASQATEKAAQAIATQQQVQTDLAIQQERAAIAERNLLAMQARNAT